MVGTVPLCLPQSYFGLKLQREETFRDDGEIFLKIGDKSKIFCNYVVRVFRSEVKWREQAVRSKVELYKKEAITMQHLLKFEQIAHANEEEEPFHLAQLNIFPSSNSLAY